MRNRMQNTKLCQSDKEIRGVSSNFNIPKYNCIRKDGHLNRTRHSGVAIYVHSSTLFTQLPVESPIQAVAIRLKLDRVFTVCCGFPSLYNLVSCIFLLIYSALFLLAIKSP